MMNLIHKLFSLIDWSMETPASYGWFHILSIAIMILVIVLIARKIKDNPDKVAKQTLLWFSVLALTLEVMKQGLFTHDASSYQWYAFPFQFCSTPMYISLLSLLVKNQKIKDALYSFLAFYGLFGGLVVMIYPNDVFISLTMINIQTMIHHGGMVVVGMTLILAGKVNMHFKGLLKATYVFASLVVLALIFDYIGYKAELGTFNMFYISPYGANHLPILSTIQQTTPYMVFLLCYILGFALAAFIMQKMGLGIKCLINYLSQKSSNEKTVKLSESQA